MTTEEKAAEILRLILDEVNSHDQMVPSQPRLSLEKDWGGNTLTVVYQDGRHTHVGYPGGDFDTLVTNLYNLLSRGGPHLSIEK